LALKCNRFIISGRLIEILFKIYSLGGVSDNELPTIKKSKINFIMFDNPNSL
jgi:hypothetical protein